MFSFEQLSQELFGAGTPGSISAYTKPAFLLQEVEENNLPEQFFGKVNGVYAFSFKVAFDSGVAFNHFVQRLFGADKKVPVFQEKFFGNGFYIECFFQLGQSR